MACLFAEIDSTGDPAVYDVTASGGTAPYTYQWKVKQNAPIDSLYGVATINTGGTTASVTLNADDSEGLLICIVTDSIGSVTTAYYHAISTAP